MRLYFLLFSSLFVLSTLTPHPVYASQNSQNEDVDDVEEEDQEEEGEEEDVGIVDEEDTEDAAPSRFSKFKAMASQKLGGVKSIASSRLGSAKSMISNRLDSVQSILRRYHALEGRVATLNEEINSEKPSDREITRIKNTKRQLDNLLVSIEAAISKSLRAARQTQDPQKFRKINSDVKSLKAIKPDLEQIIQEFETTHENVLSGQVMKSRVSMGDRVKGILSRKKREKNNEIRRRKRLAGHEDLLQNSGEDELDPSVKKSVRLSRDTNVGKLDNAMERRLKMLQSKQHNIDQALASRKLTRAQRMKYDTEKKKVDIQIKALDEKIKAHQNAEGHKTMIQTYKNSSAGQKKSARQDLRDSAENKVGFAKSVATSPLRKLRTIQRTKQANQEKVAYEEDN